jgi:hypothetical protein
MAEHIQWVNTFSLIVSYLRLYFYSDKSTDPNTRHSYTAHYTNLNRSEITEILV